ncbi:hypothetical protein JHK85_048292 [Glycine max]|nr:hypothetical protein JHK85_048292 [Glycine max]
MGFGIRKGNENNSSKRKLFPEKSNPRVREEGHLCLFRSPSDQCPSYAQYAPLKCKVSHGYERLNPLSCWSLAAKTPCPPPGLEKKISSKEREDKEIITDCFEFGFEDSLEPICGVILILPTKYIEDDQNRNILRDYAREDYFDDPSLSLKVVWVTQSLETSNNNLQIAPCIVSLANARIHK